MNAVSRRLCGAFLACLAASAAVPATAQAVYPDKPVRLVVPFPAGGPTDIFARLLAKKVSDTLGQNFIVENRPGAGGNLGTEAVAKSRADGYSLVFVSASLAIAPSLYKSLAFDPQRDLEPVALVGVLPMLLVTHAEGPASARALVDMARAQPGKHTYASAGNGSATHLGGEAFKSGNRLDVVHVPYRGTAPALTDVIAGRHLFIFDYVGPIKPYLGQGGKLKVLAIANDKRSQLLPDVPTFAEAGLPPFTASTWNMILAPTGTPAAIVTRLNEALNQALADREINARLVELGIAPVGDSTPASARAFLRDETRRWAGIVKESGATVD